MRHGPRRITWHRRPVVADLRRPAHAVLSVPGMAIAPAPLPLVDAKSTSNQLVEAISGDTAGKGEPHRLSPECASKWSPAQCIYVRQFVTLGDIGPDTGPLLRILAAGSNRCHCHSRHRIDSRTVDSAVTAIVIDL